MRNGHEQRLFLERLGARVRKIYEKVRQMRGAPVTSAPEKVLA